jgi:hypothetical protein
MKQAKLFGLDKDPAVLPERKKEKSWMGNQTGFKLVKGCKLIGQFDSFLFYSYLILEW